jgi:hypothetical protein
VTIDVCAAHGTRLDRHELVTIVRAVAEQRGVAIPEPLLTTATAGSGLGEEIARSGVGDVGAAVGSDVDGGLLEGVFTLVASLFG